MLTREDIYKKAFEAKKNALKDKKTRREMMLAAAYDNCPKLSEIDRRLSGIGASVAIKAIAGNDVSALKKQSAALTNEKKVLLSKYGVEDIKYDCPVCSDTGYVNGKICECVKHLASSFVAEELAEEMPLEDSRFDNFDLKYYPDKDTAEGNPRRRMTAILKVGNSGLGKTHLTLAIVSAVIEKGYIPVYGAAENLFSQIEREKFSGENKGAYDAMIKSDLLVIDDLGTETDNSLTKSALYNLVNSRQLSGRPTIINTNLTMKEIESRYTARISSRLIGNYDAYKFIGPDVRQQRAVEKIGK